MARLKKLENQGIDVERILQKSEHFSSKAHQSIHKAKLRSSKLQSGARVRQERLG